MASNVAVQKAHEWESLMGLANETEFDTFVSPTYFLPKKGNQAIEDTTQLIKAETSYGALLPPQSGGDDFGLKKGSCKLPMPEIPLSANVSKLLAMILTKVATTAFTGEWSHVMTLRNVVGNALSQDDAMSLCEPLAGQTVRSKLSGSRPVGFEITQEQGKFASMSVDFEGATHSLDATAVSPSITLVAACPFWKFSHLVFKVAAAAINILSLKIAVKLKHTADDGLQPVGTAARTKIDLIGIDSIKVTVKRRYAKDATDTFQSKYREDYKSKTVRALQAAWTGPLIADVKHWLLQFDFTAARIESEADCKRSETNGVITEDITWTITQPTSGEIITVTTQDDSATPATKA